jgi:hypothetical protein
MQAELPLASVPCGANFRLVAGQLMMSAGAPSRRNTQTRHRRKTSTTYALPPGSESGAHASSCRIPATGTAQEADRRTFQLSDSCGS